MTLASPKLNRLQRKVNRLQAEEARIKKTKWPRIRAACVSALLLPLLIPIHCILILVSLVLASYADPLIRRYLGYHFSLFFFFQGQKTIVATPLPSPSSQGQLIFVLKNNPLLPCYLATQVAQTGLLPYTPDLMRFPLHPLFPFLKMGRFTQTLGYLDAPLPDLLPIIHTQLKAGRTLFVPLYSAIQTPTFSDTLHCYQTVFDLLETSIPCSFLACKGLEHTKSGHPLYPNIIYQTYVPASTLFQNLPTQQAPHSEQAQRICSFYDFSTYKLI